MTSKLYTIKDISDITGVHAQTLRNWEKEDLIEPLRVAGNQRIYTDEHVQRVNDIIALKSEGYQLKGVRNVLAGKMKGAAKATKSAASKVVNEFAPKKEPLYSAAQTLAPVRPKSEIAGEEEGLVAGAPEEFETEMAAVTEEVTTPAVETPVAETSVEETPTASNEMEEESGSRYTATDLEDMNMKTLAAIARAEGIKYFRQMNKDELKVSISEPKRRQEMVDKVKARINKDKAPASAPVAETVTEEVPEVKEEPALETETPAEVAEVEETPAAKDPQQALIEQILNLGNSGKSAEDILKALAKAQQ